MDVKRVVAKSDTFTAILNDCVDELMRPEVIEALKRDAVEFNRLKPEMRPLNDPPIHDGHTDNSVDMILTSIPFGNQYEYSPSYRDMGHNSNNVEFFKQMDFLVPNLLRVLRPGRIAAIHTKDRIRFGSATGFGMPTVDRFSDQTCDCFEKHGFKFIGRITIDTDVVRENAQTYRLGWSENAKDSSKMGCGMPEYVLLFRKLPTDTSNAYADVPVTKDKEIYLRSDWQLDAAGFWRSSGNRLPDPDYLAQMDMQAIGAWWRDYCLKGGYDYKEHVKLAKILEGQGRLPASFMLFPPISRNKDVWTDIARMRTLNSEQERNQARKHLCPLALDLIERLVTRYTNEGEIVLDPFAGIFSVPYMAVKMGRIGVGIELSEEYWRNGVGYCEMAEQKATAPTLFDMSQFKSEKAGKEDVFGAMADGNPVED
jgi:DNA modification methylase